MSDHKSRTQMWSLVVGLVLGLGGVGPEAGRVSPAPRAALQSSASGPWILVETKSDPNKRSREEPQIYEGKNLGGYDRYTMQNDYFKAEIVRYGLSRELQNRYASELFFDNPPVVIQPGASFELKIRGKNTTTKASLHGGASGRFGGPGLEDQMRVCRIPIAYDNPATHNQECATSVKFTAGKDVPEEFSLVQIAQGQGVVGEYRYCRNGKCPSGNQGQSVAAPPPPAIVPPQSDEAQRYRLLVKVVSADRKLPVAGARVEIVSAGQRSPDIDNLTRRETTGGDGIAIVVFEFLPSQGRTYNIVATHPDFQDGASTYSMPAGTRARDISIGIELQRNKGAKIVVVELVDGNNQPVPDAQIMLRGDVSASATSDVSGEAEIQLKPETGGAIHVSIEHPKFESITDELNIGRFGDQVRYDLRYRLRRLGISGAASRQAHVLVQTTCSDGRTLPVKFADVAMDGFSNVKITGRDGVATFYHGVPPGEMVQVQASKRGYRPGTASFNVGNRELRGIVGRALGYDGDHVTIDLSPDPGVRVPEDLTLAGCKPPLEPRPAGAGSRAAVSGPESPRELERGIGAAGPQRAAGCGLGARWRVSESGWQGTWTRRGVSTVFDAEWTKGTLRVSAIMDVATSGNRLLIRRVPGGGYGDGLFCAYEGTMVPGTGTISGNYQCNGEGLMAWRAVIECR